MAKITTPLHPKECETAPPKPDKDYFLYDGEGLRLKIAKSATDTAKTATKTWYYFWKGGKFTFGRYPTVGLHEARVEAKKFKEWEAKGLNPKEEYQRLKNPPPASTTKTFEVVAREWMSDVRSKQAASTKSKDALFLGYAIKEFGQIPIDHVIPKNVLDACRKKEKEGLHETAHRILNRCSQVFRYAVGEDYIKSDPCRDLKGNLKPIEGDHYPAIVDIDALGQLLRDIPNYNGEMNTIYLMLLSAMLFVRPAELRYARWSDIDLKTKLWSYTPPKTRNQTGLELIVPLAQQAITILKKIKETNGDKEHVFYSARAKVHGVISENTDNQALVSMGYKGKQTMHGFRAIARTVLRERLGWDAEYLEMQLGHAVADVHGRAYNRTQLLADRVVMMAEWANYLDALREGRVDTTINQVSSREIRTFK